ncbi:excinuclease ABC subunit A [Bacillus atrophaeus]|uniref:excinuclease ABC subunit UvrA n=1 Tax=Bacillus atrophaeus TaxID=1452 RepID=UPI000D0593CE|nr:excinuclease ABC subunit UvrA [Bacillus atrophaeus]MCY8910323.1 excinuclease ABC subunit UvrA [Bacillus atrophaeus]MEC0835922.1 excinuclease ABC subunit UvrA [Bacillus atrophaeus]MEC0847028.1 excinuclease ABC subunit UvrA [Bacillus atrophaeus]MEC0848343.1 excinuclease ABC subunit UvrA [Bacillus atrophaeus]MEC0864802.1 excinuclease ABC subunit UvrA [Bacillus atrophaeus]
MKNITIKGARIHNLKEINISIPKNKLVVATGVSGSGKSSLMFDIVFEEGRREYLQAIGMFPGLEDERKFDSISGIGPTIAVQQSVVRQSNPRSTVGSRTHILGLLGLLYSSEGQIACSECDTLLEANSTCNTCGNEEERLELGYFSYNNANGMCMKCSGRGAYYRVNIEKLVPDERITVREIFQSIGVTPGIGRVLERNLKENMDMPFSKLPEEIKEEVIYGHYVTNNSANQSFCVSRILHSRYKKGEYVNGLYELATCPECQGYRIGEEARRVFLNGNHIGQVGKMNLTEAKGFLENVLENEKLTESGKNLLRDILRKLTSLINYRLGYLSLYREMSSLSGGEIQRLFLNSHLESKMESLIYILDEPTVGLHESEKAQLLTSIKALKELGNTVILVEHDKRTIEMAEHIIDIGPNAGIEGGQVIYEGDFEGLLKSDKSLTGQYLSGKAKMPLRRLKQDIAEDKTLARLTIHHAKTNTLKDVTVSFPLGVLAGVAGVSGSGKSSLISDTLIPLLKSYFKNNSKNGTTNLEESEIDVENESTLVETIAEKLDGVEHLSGFAEVSQAPIGRSINSNPITFTKTWDKIRKLFAEQPEAKRLNLTAGHFSFNSKGACPECGGSGRKAIFPSSSIKMYTTCEECKGKRYNEESLTVRYKGKNISEVLDMQISEAVSLFKDEQSIVSVLKVMERIGMGYITLGQPTSTMSGGEVQRLKLAKEIGKKRKGNILYVLDEPTTGLSLYDTAQLIKLLNELVEQGNSVIVIEHNHEVLESCDWIIELGPEGGAEGGRIIAEGAPQDLKKNPNSITGKYLERI